MRIIHVVESLARGGLERMVCDLAAAQFAAGHQVSVLCIFTAGVLAEELERAGISVVALRKQSGLSFPVLSGIRMHVRQRRPDIVHTHNSTAHYYTAAATIGLPRIALLNTRHGMGGCRTDRRERLYRFASQRTKAVAAVCEQARRRFVSDGIVPASLACVVPNGIGVGRFTPAGPEERAAAKHMFGIEPSRILLGSVGRLNWAKDHVFLLEAFARMRQQTPGAALAIVGGGELYESIKAHSRTLALNDSVVMMGDRPDVPALLRAFDTFVLSSRTEGYSIALLEAAAAGLPIVATDVGGNSEIVQHNVTGVLVPHGNVDALAAALSQIASDSPMRFRMGLAGRLWAEEHASIAAMTTAYDRLYESALTGGPLAYRTSA